jgi:hypothetical protein
MHEADGLNVLEQHEVGAGRCRQSEHMLDKSGARASESLLATYNRHVLAGEAGHDHIRRVDVFGSHGPDVRNERHVREPRAQHCCRVGGEVVEKDGPVCLAEAQLEPAGAAKQAGNPHQARRRSGK